ncbi:MAG: nuclear transport factor 2 family protein [Cyanobacteria bacterium P01_F01_bin.4]
MDNLIENQILETEERLRLAMLHSDVSALDKLLAPELIFTNHLGQLLSKQEDLAAHQSGVLKIRELTPSEQHLQVYESFVIVSVRVHLSGSYADTSSEDDFRFTRVWVLSSEHTWQVVAAHSSIISS